jgi:hypothetical protein
MAKRVATPALLQHPDLQRAIQRVQQHSVGHRRLERRCCGPKLA